MELVRSSNRPDLHRDAIAGQVKEAEAIQKETLLQYQQTIQNAFRDVEDPETTPHPGQLEALTRQVEALRTYARVARFRYDNGYTSYIEGTGPPSAACGAPN